MIQVQHIPINDLRPAEYNPRKISKAELDKLKKNITEFGMVDPIIINHDMTVIGGHQRLKVCKALKMETMPCIAVNVSKEKEKALNLSLNRISGEWDEETLKQVIGDLASLEEFDMELTGFDSKEIDAMIASIGKGAKEEEEFDAESEAAKITEPRTKRGDVWLLGKHRVMCGDSTVITDVEKLMNGKKANLCLTDPPYGVGLNYNDFDDTVENVKQLAESWLPLARSISDVVVFSPGVTRQWLYPIPSWVMCWFYGAGQSCSSWGFSCWQPFLCYGKDPSLSIGKGRRPDAVDMNIPANSKDIDHPCPKPLKLIEWLINRLSFSRGQIIFEPFCGSGTTLIAAEKMGRICYGIELSSKYCDVIINRWEKYTGKIAVLENAMEPVHA